MGAGAAGATPSIGVTFGEAGLAGLVEISGGLRGGGGLGHRHGLRLPPPHLRIEPLGGEPDGVAAALGDLPFL